MQSERVVVEVVSPLKCQAEAPSCYNCHIFQIEVPFVHPTCQGCGRLQSPADFDYFSILGEDRKFSIHLDTLEKRFYEISKILHPDRFSLATAQVRQLSLEWMSFVNVAYQTLKDPQQLQEYLLKLEGIEVKINPPVFWAERWFEVQEQGESSKQQFQKDLIKEYECLKEKSDVYKQCYDQEKNRDLLKKIAVLRYELKFLDSLRRQVSLR